MNKATYTVILYLCIALQLVNHLLYTQECYNNQIALLILIIIATVVYGSYRKYKKAIKTVAQYKIKKIKAIIKITPYPFYTIMKLSTALHLQHKKKYHKQGELNEKDYFSLSITPISGN